MLKLLGIFIIALYFLTLPRPTNAAIEFSLANPQSDGETVTIDVSVSGLTSSSCAEGKCYLQGAFRQGNSTYFGLTQNNNGDWYQYMSKPGKDNIKSKYFYFEPTDGAWQGSLTVKVDPDASGYKGPGTYELKALRFSGNSDQSTDDSDNTLSVELNVLTPSNDESSNSPNPSAPPDTLLGSSSSKSPSPTPKSSPNTLTKKSPSPSPKTLGTTTKPSPQVENPKTPNIEESIAQVDANQFVAPSPPTSTQTAPKKLAGFLVGAGAVLVSLSGAGLFWIKRNEQQPQIQKGREQFGPKEE